MRASEMNQKALDELRGQVSGIVIVPGDRGYDDARSVFNAMIDKRPRVIVQCENVDDVVNAIGFGRDLDVEIAVRGGGHGVQQPRQTMRSTCQSPIRCVRFTAATRCSRPGHAYRT